MKQPAFRIGDELYFKKGDKLKNIVYAVRLWGPTFVYTDHLGNIAHEEDLFEANQQAKPHPKYKVGDRFEKLCYYEYNYIIERVYVPVAPDYIYQYGLKRIAREPCDELFYSELIKSEHELDGKLIEEPEEELSEMCQDVLNQILDNSIKSLFETFADIEKSEGMWPGMLSGNPKPKKEEEEPFETSIHELDNLISEGYLSRPEYRDGSSGLLNQGYYYKSKLVGKNKGLLDSKITITDKDFQLKLKEAIAKRDFMSMVHKMADEMERDDTKELDEARREEAKKIVQEFNEAPRFFEPYFKYECKCNGGKGWEDYFYQEMVSADFDPRTGTIELDVVFKKGQ